MAALSRDYPLQIADCRSISVSSVDTHPWMENANTKSSSKNTVRGVCTITNGVS